MLHHAEDNGIDPVSRGMSQYICAFLWKCFLIQNTRTYTVVDIMIYIGDLIGYSYYLSFQCRRTQACLVISYSVTDLPCKVKAFSVFLDPFNYSDALLVMTEESSAAGRKSSLSYMTEGCMSDIMAQGDGFRQIFICPDGLGNSSCQLCNFQSMGKAGSVMIPVRRQKNLGLMLHPSERFGMNKLIPVSLI